MTANYYYEIVIYRNDVDQSMMLPKPSGDNTKMTIVTVINDTGTIANEDIINIEKYQQMQTISLNKIYILTKEAGAINSLYIDFTPSFAGVASSIFEFEFEDLGLSSFKVGNGDRISCYLST